MLARKGSGPKTIAGYSALSVLSRSMQSEIPQGSLVITHQINPGSIKVGDAITYMVSPTTSVTHQVIAIYSNYQNKGMPYFQTKGVDNSAPDKELVAASNVLGKVIWHVPYVGRIAKTAGNNALQIFIALIVLGALLWALYLCLRYIFSPASNYKSSTSV